MKGSPLQRLDQRIRHALPFLSVVIAILLVSTPTRLPGFASVAPQLPLAAIYYWSIYRPDLLRPWAAFVLGAVADIIAGAPLGVSSLVFLAVLGVSGSQRRVLGKSFLVGWWGFAMTAAGAAVVEWLMNSIIMVTLLPVQAVVFQYLMTVSIYPLLAWAFVRAQLTLLRRG